MRKKNAKAVILCCVGLYSNRNQIKLEPHPIDWSPYDDLTSIPVEFIMESPRKRYLSERCYPLSLAFPHYCFLILCEVRLKGF